MIYNVIYWKTDAYAKCQEEARHEWWDGPNQAKLSFISVWGTLDVAI